MRIINRHFIEYFGKLSPEIIGRPFEDTPMAIICVDITFAQEWSGMSSDRDLMDFFKPFAFDGANDLNTILPSNQFVKAALAKGKIAYINMPRNGYREGYFIPEFRPDGSMEALHRAMTLNALAEDAERQINQFFFESEEAPDTSEEADDIVRERFPLLSYHDVLKEQDLGKLVDDFENCKDCDCPDNDIWQACVGELMQDIQELKAKALAKKRGWPLRIYYNGDDGILWNENACDNGNLMAVYNFPYGHEALRPEDLRSDIDENSNVLSSVEQLHLKYGWPLKIHARGEFAYLAGSACLPESQSTIAPLYRFSDDEISIVRDKELFAVI